MDQRPWQQGGRARRGGPRFRRLSRGGWQCCRRERSCTDQHWRRNLQTGCLGVLGIPNCPTRGAEAQMVSYIVFDVESSVCVCVCVCVRTCFFSSHAHQAFTRNVHDVKDIVRPSPHSTAPTPRIVPSFHTGGPVRTIARKLLTFSPPQKLLTQTDRTPRHPKRDGSSANSFWPLTTACGSTRLTGAAVTPISAA